MSRAISSAARPRSSLGAYAIRVDYYPSEDRLTLSYSIGRPVVPGPWRVVEEDPIGGLWVDPTVDVSEVIRDIPPARGLLNVPPREDALVATAALDRVAGMLRDLDGLL